MSFRRAAVVVTISGALVVSCANVETGSREHFSKELTCPIDRVESHPRPDVHRSDLKAKDTPPKEVAADPARLKMWQDKQKETSDWQDSLDQFFDVRGCDHQKLMACHRHNKNTNVVMCSSYEYTAGVTAKW